MNSNPFEALLKNDVQADESYLKWLEEEIVKAPFAAGLYVRRALVAQQLDSENFERFLNQAAARTLSRARLKEWIEGPVRLEIEWLLIPSVEIEPEESGTEKSFSNESPEPHLVEESEETEGLSPQIDEVELPEVALEEIVEITSDESVLPFGYPSEEISVPAESMEIQVTESVESIDIPAKKAIKKNEFGFTFVKVKSPKILPKENEISAYQLPATPIVKKRGAKKPEDEIIEKFLEKNPALPKIDFGDREMVKDDLAKSSGTLAEEIVTENMAMIYMKQKNFEKALQTFRKLQLKFPEKSDYFAALIKNLENQNSL